MEARKSVVAFSTILTLFILFSFGKDVMSIQCDYCCNLDFLNEAPFFCHKAEESSECTFTYDGVYFACCAVSGYLPCTFGESGATAIAYYYFATGDADCGYACGYTSSQCSEDFIIAYDNIECERVGSRLSHLYTPLECAGGSGNSCF